MRNFFSINKIAYLPLYTETRKLKKKKKGYSEAEFLQFVSTTHSLFEYIHSHMQPSTRLVKHAKLNHIGTVPSCVVEGL